MSSALVFCEPPAPVVGPFDGVAHWLRGSGCHDARAARSEINEWYAAFPDKSGMVLSRLRGDDDIGVYQAIDELYVHHLLSESYEARYEEDDGSPDFRLYRSNNYVAGVEVITLFADQGFDSEVSRNARLVEEIRNRVASDAWYVSLRVVQWSNDPRPTDIVRWLEATIVSLSESSVNLTQTSYPAATYRTDDVELEFTFIPRSRNSGNSTGRISILGPPVVQFVRPAFRLRRGVGQKAGSRYDLRDAPYAVVVSVRDYSCDVEDVVSALYGDEIVVVDVEEPSSAHTTRKRNGLFTISPGNPEGRNTRLSCVYVLMRGWVPRSDTSTKILRLDNAFARHVFPEDPLIPNWRFVAHRTSSGLYMSWEDSE